MSDMEKLIGYLSRKEKEKEDQARFWKDHGMKLQQALCEHDAFIYRRIRNMAETIGDENGEGTI